MMEENILSLKNRANDIHLRDFNTNHCIDLNTSTILGSENDSIKNIVRINDLIKFKTKLITCFITSLFTVLRINDLIKTRTDTYYNLSHFSAHWKRLRSVTGLMAFEIKRTLDADLFVFIDV